MAILRGVCQFLGIEYDPRMLKYDEDSTYGKPDGSLALRWRTSMPARDAARVDARCGRLLAARGYEASRSPTVRLGQGSSAWLSSSSHRTRRAAMRIRKYGVRLWALDHFARLLRSRQLGRRARARMNLVDATHLK